MRSRGLEKNPNTNKPGTFIRHLRVVTIIYLQQNILRQMKINSTYLQNFASENFVSCLLETKEIFFNS